MLRNKLANLETNALGNGAFLCGVYWFLGAPLEALIVNAGLVTLVSGKTASSHFPLSIGTVRCSLPGLTGVDGTGSFLVGSGRDDFPRCGVHFPDEFPSRSRLLFLFVPVRFVFIRVCDSGLFVLLVNNAHRYPLSSYIIIYNEVIIATLSSHSPSCLPSIPFSSLDFPGI